MITLGKYALVASLVFSLGAVWLLALGMRWDRKDVLRNGYYAVYAFFLTTVVAGAVLLQAFLKKDFSFGYVVENSDASLSTFYRIAGFWAGQQGSFLLWLLLIAVVAVVIALLDLNKVERLTGGAVMVMCVIGAVFAALMVLDTGSKPFVAAEAGATPLGLNPLLLHPAMVLHPPALFIGYVGLAVPFAFGVSTLLLGRADKLWVTLSQKWAVAGWLFLSLGVGLGAWWAYVILSWGGYWGWDPVENTSLVPWLTATALLHAFTLYKSRGLFKHWALGLAAATFWFTILATWTTRTGVIQSVHAFPKSSVLVWILSGFLVAVAAALAAEAVVGTLLARDVERARLLAVERAKPDVVAAGLAQRQVFAHHGDDVGRFAHLLEHGPRQVVLAHRRPSVRPAAVLAVPPTPRPFRRSPGHGLRSTLTCPPTPPRSRPSPHDTEAGARSLQPRGAARARRGPPGARFRCRVRGPL